MTRKRSQTLPRNLSRCVCQMRTSTSFRSMSRCLWTSSTCQELEAHIARDWKILKQPCIRQMFTPSDILQTTLLHFALHLNGCDIWSKMAPLGLWVFCRSCRSFVVLDVGSKMFERSGCFHPSDWSLWSLLLEKTSNKSQTPDLAADPLKLQTQTQEPRWVRTSKFFDSYTRCITNSAFCFVTIQAKSSSVA